jgi:hypothetical protein
MRIPGHDRVRTSSNAHSRILLSVSSAGTAFSVSVGVTYLANPTSSCWNACTSSSYLELGLQDASGLVENGVGHGQLDLAHPRKFEEFERLASAQERGDEDVRVCDDPGHRAVRCSCTASTAIWIASSSVVASAISRL